MNDEVDLKTIGVTFKKAEDLTGLSYKTLWNLVNDGRLRIARIGERTFILYRSLEELFESNKMPKGRPGRSKHADKLISTRSRYPGKSKLEGADAAD